MNSYIPYLLLNIPRLILSLRINKNQVFIRTHKFSSIFLFYFLYKDWNSQFKSLIDFTAVDYMNREKRFNLIYHLISVLFNFRAFVKCFLYSTESMYSMTYLFPNISWYERECWDFFGIYFSNNKNLRRLLLDYGFVGHPFRKDFPLTGFIEVVYSIFYFNVIQRKVALKQSYRKYEIKSPWKNKLTK